MSFLSHYERGGQTSIHSLRMKVQVFGFAIKIGLVIFMIALLMGGLFNFKKEMFAHYIDYRSAQIKLLASKEATLEIKRGGRAHKVKAQHLIHSPFYVRNAVLFESELKRQAGVAIYFAVAGIFLLALFWMWYGRSQIGKNHERGSEIVPKSLLKKIILKNRAESQFKIDDLPYLKAYETRHFLITGTTGSGKSNCLNGFINQLYKQKSQAIIVDVTGGFVERFYDETTDSILNIFDKRGAGWNFWKDIDGPANIETFCKSLIPDSKANHDPFWQNAARTVLSDAMQRYREKGKRDLRGLYALLAEVDLQVLCLYLKGTPAATLVSVASDKLAISVRSTLIQHIKLFKYLTHRDDGISIREWMGQVDQSNNRRLFFTASQANRELLKPLISALFDLSMNALMTLKTSDKRRVWMIIDELAALQKLNALETGLAEIRKYGGAIIACLQNKSQLESIYGALSLKNMLDNFNTKLFFRASGREIASWVSDTLGKSEIIDHVESRSYGAHAMRDGVSISKQTKLTSLLLPEEIQKFEDLEVVIKLPGNYPITRFKTKFNSIEPKADGFIANDLLLNPPKIPEDLLQLFEKQDGKGAEMPLRKRNIVPKETQSSYLQNTEDKELGR